MQGAQEDRRDALAWAEAQVAVARDDPAARLALLARTYHGPTGRAPRHLPFRRAALSFMRWQAQRGLLNPLDATPSGSVWWRAINERLLRDGCEAIALVGGLRGDPSSQCGAAVARVRRHTDTVLLVPGSQRQHRGRLLGARSARRRGERSGALLHQCRAGARPLRARPRRGPAHGAGAALSGSAARSATPGSGLAGAFLSLRRVIPNHYPLARDVEWYIADEQRLGRLLDYAVIAPRLQRLYEWSAEELDEPRLLDADPGWQPDLRLAVRGATRLALRQHMPFAAAVLERVTRAR